jgi:hypothetical protein
MMREQLAAALNATLAETRDACVDGEDVELVVAVMGTLLNRLVDVGVLSQQDAAWVEGELR